MPANVNPTPAEIVAALQRGGLVEALKLVLAAKGARTSGGKSLGGQAPHRAEPLIPTPRPSKLSDLSPGEVPRSNGDIWLFLLVIAAVCVTYYVLAR